MDLCPANFKSFAGRRPQLKHLVITEMGSQHNTWWERDELINNSKYIIGSARKQSPVFFNKSCFTIFTGKYLLKSLFKHSCCLVNIAEVLRSPVLKNICKRLLASIRCYFDTINSKQSGFCKTYSFKILVSERKYKNNLKNRESQKNILQCMFHYKIPWFYQDLKSANLCFLNL